MTIDAETLMAYADGELDPVTAKRVEKAVAADPALAAQVEKHRKLRETLRAHFDPIADEAAPVRLAGMVRGPAEVVSLGAARQAREAKEAAKASPKPVAANSNWWRTFGGVAAALVIGIALGVTSRSGLGSGGGSLATQNERLVAQGEMAKGLDTQLASKDGLVRLSFRDAKGGYCRVFEAGARSGVACREGADWAIRSYRQDGRAEQGEYRQAGSASVMADAQAMMAGEPLDTAAEKAALAKGWK